MAIQYVCRFCHTPLGTLDEQGLSEHRLGFDRLTPEERKDIISNDMNGNYQVRVTCEICQQILEHNPERILYPSLYH
jgi:Protein of unknown function (DUF2757)